MASSNHSRQLMCLIKLFPKQEYLDDLLRGIFYCNTPEFYRNHHGAGVGDKNESCISSYRIHRDLEAPILTINGHTIDGLESMTVHGNGIKDSWLHCWFTFYLPETDEEFYSQIKDLKRVREEFGKFFAIIDGQHINQVAQAIREQGHNVEYGAVLYSDKKVDWSARCKSSNYHYQREFRFLIDGCGSHDVEPKKVQLGSSVSSLFKANEKFEMKDSKSGEVLLSLSANGIEHI